MFEQLTECACYTRPKYGRADIFLRKLPHMEYTVLLNQTRLFSPKEALMIGKASGVDWNQVDLEQFRMGLSVELEHGAETPKPIFYH